MRLLVSILAVLAFPAAAWASPASIVSRDVPLRGGERTLAASAPRFNLVGLHWRGSGSVEFRTRSLSGRWSAWRPAAPEDDRPDSITTERSVPGWQLGNPYWTGRSDRLEVRTWGRVDRVRAHYVWSPVEGSRPRALSQAGAPAIVTRAAWEANELIKRAPPSYASQLRFAVVHHTAGSNSYTRAQSAAIVKGIQLYHVRANGWNDLGYNFLVDKYGQVFEGRYGGMERNVVGAHAEGFNTGSVGVAVIGNYNSTTVPAAAQKALTQLLAWRLDVAHVDPLSTFSWPSGGNAKFPRNVPVFLRTIVGHRDTGFTDCPGDVLYGKLDTFATTVAQTGLPKLYTPVVRGGVGSQVRFTARLSSAQPWAVTVMDAVGIVVASGAGAGANVDWTWDATAAAPGAYTWTIASQGVRSATGVLGKGAALSVSRVTAEPGVVTPNGDGVSDTAAISYTLGAAAVVTATVVDAAGRTVATLFSEPRGAGQQGFAFSAEGIPDGAYTIVITAVNGGGKQATGRVAILVSRTLFAYAAGRAAFSPNGDGRLDSMPFTFTLGSPATVRLRILREGKWVATPVPSLALPAGPQMLAWDGRKRLGLPPDGIYDAELSVTDAVGTVKQTVRFISDRTRPELRLLSLRPLRFRLTEPATVVIWFDGRRRVVTLNRDGDFWGAGRATKVRAVAYDPAGNRSAVVQSS
jgi:N-acetylmuramoyl-L-alanine amidase